MYSLKIYPEISLTGTPQIVTSSDIFALDLGGKRYSNSNPFEIVGNQANVSIIYNSSLWSYLSSSQLYEVISLWKVINSSYFNRLVQIINDQTGVVSFTGLIKATDLAINTKDDTIEITISDTLYVYISLLSDMRFIDTEVKKSNLLNNLSEPLGYLPAVLNNSNLDLSALTDVIISDIAMEFDGYERPASSWYYYDVWSDPHEFDIATDWARVGRDSNIWVREASSDELYLSFWVTFRQRNVTNTVLRAKYIVIKYVKSPVDTGFVLMQPEIISTDVITASGGSALVAYGILRNSLEDKRCLPNNTNFNLFNGTAYWGEQFENEEHVQYAVYAGTTNYFAQGSESITLNADAYGSVTGTLNLNLDRILFDENTTNDRIKALFAAFMLNANAKPSGGVNFYPSLIRAYGSQIPVVIADTDIVQFTGRGSLLAVDNMLSAFSAVANSYTMERVFKQYFERFFDNIRAEYQVTIANTSTSSWQPFQAFNIKGKTMYLISWSRPVLGDVINMELIGAWS